MKGQALQSDQGRVKVAEIDIDTEFSKHFSEFKNPKDQKVIKQYMKYLKNAGKQGKLFTAKEIDDQMTKLPGNPFKGTVNPELRQKTVAEFMEINKNGAEVKNGPPTNKTERPKATPIMFDVVSALQNQQYTKEMAIDAVETAIKKNKSLMNDFDGLFKAALNKN